MVFGLFLHEKRAAKAQAAITFQWRLVLSDMLVWRRGRGAAAAARMASSSSPLSSLPRLFIPPHRGSHEAAMAASPGASQALRNGGGMQMQVSCSMFEASSLKFFNLLFLGSNSDLFCCSILSLVCAGRRILWCRGGLRWCCVAARIGAACRSCGTGWCCASGSTSARGPGTPTSAPTSTTPRRARPTAKVS